MGHTDRVSHVNFWRVHERATGQGGGVTRDADVCTTRIVPSLAILNKNSGVIHYSFVPRAASSVVPSGLLMTLKSQDHCLIWRIVLVAPQHISLTMK